MLPGVIPHAGVAGTCMRATKDKIEHQVEKSTTCCHTSGSVLPACTQKACFLVSRARDIRTHASSMICRQARLRTFLLHSTDRAEVRSSTAPGRLALYATWMDPRDARIMGVEPADQSRDSGTECLSPERLDFDPTIDRRHHGPRTSHHGRLVTLRTDNLTSNQQVTSGGSLRGLWAFSGSVLSFEACTFAVLAEPRHDSAGKSARSGRVCPTLSLEETTKKTCSISQSCLFETSHPSDTSEGKELGTRYLGSCNVARICPMTVEIPR